MIRYTASLENLGNYPIDHVYYPERIQLPHEQRFSNLFSHK
jgi:hypothetical protein